MLEQNNNHDYVWYASYGSNLLNDRFLIYILGGQFPGNKREYPGCKDKTRPLSEHPIIINYELYFAKESTGWNNGGVGFIRNEFDNTVITYGNMYLISKRQFIDVIKQEISSQGDDTKIDFNAAATNGSEVFKDGSWYGKIISLGTKDNYPIFTFTHQRNYKNSNKPSAAYLSVIIKGLKKSHNLVDEVIVAYLLSKNGVRDNYSQEELAELVTKGDIRL